MENQNYPKQTTDGFSYNDEDDELMKIETNTYENGKQVKRVTLRDGRKAIIRMLKAWEMEESQRFHKNNQELLLIAVAAKAIKIDDKPVLFEDIKEMDAPDWVSIKGAVALLNFM
jgi:urease accessory protein UreE